MSFDTDMVIDRRRLKRRLIFWRIFGVLAVVAALSSTFGQFDFVGNKEQIARLNIDGIIINDPLRDKKLDQISKASHVKALILVINSPGGTFTGGENLYHSLRKFSQEKPVVALMGGTATSAAYMAAIAADHIIAGHGTITGSIGVLLQTANFTELMNKVGIKSVIVKSGPMKAQPNPMEPFSDDARAVTASIIKDFFDIFVGMVIDRRKMDKSTAYKLADGRIYSGGQALSNGLIDALGREPDALKWLVDEHKISEKIPIVDVKIDYKEDKWHELFGNNIRKALFSEILRLDGMLSLWHPDSITN
jgi:protease-4